MSNHRFQLERKGQKKYICPACGKHKIFVRYIDAQDNNYLADHVGRCDREVNCGYHYKPSDYFAEDAGAKERYKDYTPQPYTPAPRVNIPVEIMQATLQGYEENTFINWLTTIFPLPVVKQLIANYHIGTSKHYKGGGAIFWFISKGGEVRYGQVKAFDTSGHTATFSAPDGDVRKCQNSAVNLFKKALLKSSKELPAWIEPYEAQELKIDTAFGAHLLALPENNDKPIAIVEAPKTAIVAAGFFPQFVWLAIGALSYLKRSRCGILAGRDVILYPDLKAADAWQERIKAEELDKVCNTITVSRFLEEHATEDERGKGLDLCDYLEKLSYLDFLKDELIEEITAPGQSAQPDEIIRRYALRGLSQSYYETRVLPTLINDHQFIAA